VNAGPVGLLLAGHPEFVTNPLMGATPLLAGIRSVNVDAPEPVLTALARLVAAPRQKRFASRAGELRRGSRIEFAGQSMAARRRRGDGVASEAQDRDVSIQTSRIVVHHEYAHNHDCTTGIATDRQRNERSIELDFRFAERSGTHLSERSLRKELVLCSRGGERTTTIPN
jgi:hypothetical protein